MPLLIPPVPVLKIEHLKRCLGSLAAVNDVSFEVYEGEILGLLGPNGAGKTTTISMLCGLLQPDSGQIFYQGCPIKDNPSTRQAIGMCPQSIVIWKNLTCLEQLIFIAEMYNLTPRVGRQRGEVLLVKLGLAEKRHKLAATLSGGMQRRLNLALALVHDPHILVLDEPEAGLDPQSRVLVREFIREWARQPGRSVILTTHNMDEADRMAQRVAIIDQGVLLVVDTPERLKNRLGDGDVLEIELLAGGDVLELGLQAARQVAPGAYLSGSSLVVRSRGAVELLPAIVTALHALRQNDIHTGEVRLRASTLEDVFLSLTGRTLRE
jgi:ABC-2 type transport system ATP-binding protein